MKKTILLLFVTLLVGCETKTIEVEKSAGIVERYPGNGDGFVMASTEDAQLAVDLITVEIQELLLKTRWKSHIIF